MKTHLTRILSGAFVLATLVSFTVLAQAPSYTVAFYNVENLYDTINNPYTDDEEFLPEGKNFWDGKKYFRKLNFLAKALDSLGDADGPEIVGLCEIENRTVLEDLTNRNRLKNKHYGIVHQDSPDKRGVDVGLLYKKDVFSPTSYRAYNIRFAQDTAARTRDVLLVAGKLAQEPIYFVVNHWPSRRGGEAESAPRRKAVAAKVRQIVDSLQKQEPLVKIVIMGDFNDEPNNESIEQVLLAKYNETGLTKGELFNAMYPLKKEGKGSYQYNKQWNMLDQMMVSEGLLSNKSGLQYVPNSAQIFAPVWMQDFKYPGAPYRTFAGGRYLGGYSDHFPVFIHLQKK